MKRLLLFALTAIFFVSAQAQLDIDKITKSKRAIEIFEEISELKENYPVAPVLKGNVSIYKMKTYTKGENGEVNYRITMFSFDEQSRPDRTYVKEGDDETGVVYKYRDKNNQYKSISLASLEKHTAKSQNIEYLYTPEDKLEYMNWIELGVWGDKLIYSLLYKYSPDGNLIERWDKTTYDEEYKLNTVYRYENGKLVKILISNIDGSLNTESILSYDDNGNLASMSRENFGILHIEYDKAGNVKQETDLTYTVGDTVNVIKYRYNNLNEEIARTEISYIYNPDIVNRADDEYLLQIADPDEPQILYMKTIKKYKNNTIKSDIQYTGNENGDFVESSEIVYENEFDSHGNLIEQIEKNSYKEILEKTICEIEYY